MITTTKPPFISLNKLAEFMAAKPVRQRAIVQMFKTGKPVSQYREAHEAAAKFLASGQDISVLNESIRNLVALDSITPSKFRERSILALQDLKSICPMNLGTANYHHVALNAHSGLDIEGVFVSVRPDILLTYKTKKGLEMGAAKMYFPVGNPLGDDGGECVAVVLNQYLNHLSGSLGTPKPHLCHSIDVHRGEVAVASGAHVHMMNNVKEACKNYLLKWNSI